MADPTPQMPGDEPGAPIYGGYLESSERPPLSAVPSPGSARRPARTSKPKTYPRGWAGDIDTYELADPLYDPDGWYTAVKGADKQSRNQHVRLPEYLCEALDQIVAGRYFPAVKTSADFVRSALVHELHRRIGEIRDPAFNVQVSAHTDLATINAIRAENEAKREFVHYCKTELADIDGNPSMMRKVLERVWAALDGGQYDGKLHAELKALHQKYWVDRGFSGKPRPVE